MWWIGSTGKIETRLRMKTDASLCLGAQSMGAAKTRLAGSWTVCDMPGCPLHVGYQGQGGLVLLNPSLAAFDHERK
jgi:hypothetical protein